MIKCLKLFRLLKDYKLTRNYVAEILLPLGCGFMVFSVTFNAAAGVKHQPITSTQFLVSLIFQDGRT